MSESVPEFEIFTTLDEGKAKNALGGVPYVATTVEVGNGRVWVVKGFKKNRWPDT